MEGKLPQERVKEKRSGWSTPAWVHGCWNSVGSGALESAAMPSSATTMMLVSDDRSLVESCQGVVDSFPDLRLIVIGRVREADPYLSRDQIKLILFHLPREGDTS